MAAGEPFAPLSMSTNEPFVSVVTPVYNTADYLREAIESVLDSRTATSNTLSRITVALTARAKSHTNIEVR